MTARKRINFKFFSRILKKSRPRKVSYLFFFSTEKLTRLLLLKEDKPSTDCKMIIQYF